jgi:hypothetical protein
VKLTIQTQSFTFVKKCYFLNGRFIPFDPNKKILPAREAGEQWVVYTQLAQIDYAN